MKNKKVSIKIITSAVLIMIMLFNITSVYASSLASNYQGTSSEADNGIKSIIGMVLSGIRIICLAGAVSLLMWMGVKYMLASASERADLKKNLIQYAIGAVIMFASSGLLSILKSFVDGSLGTA